MSGIEGWLAHLAALGENWDSYGALPPTAEALRAVDNLSFSGTSDGGVDIELIIGNTYLSVVIGPDGSVEEVFHEVDPS